MAVWLHAAWQICRRRGRGVGRVVLWAIVIVWAFHLWFRAPSPVWTSAVIPGGTVPIGFTADGKLVTVDGQQDGPEYWRISTWTVETGELVHQSPTDVSLKSLTYLLWSRSTDSIINTSVDPKFPKPRDMFSTNWLIESVSRLDGRSRFSPWPAGRVSELLASPDGRYLLVMREWDAKQSHNANSLIDLHTSQEVLSIPVQDETTSGRTQQDGFLGNSGMIFTEDSRELVSLEYDAALRWVLVFRSIPTGLEVARLPLPEIRKVAELGLRICQSGRIWFWYGLERGYTPSGLISFRLKAYKLLDQRQEPGFDFVPGFDDPAEWCHSIIGNGWKAYGQFSENRRSLVKQTWNRVVSALRLRGEVDDELAPEGSVQFVSPLNDWSIGPSIPIMGHDGTNFSFEISPDGQWLADGGERLRVYRTPPRRWARVAGVALLLFLAQLVDRRLRRHATLPLA